MFACTGKTNSCPLSPAPCPRAQTSFVDAERRAAYETELNTLKAVTKQLQTDMMQRDAAITALKSGTVIAGEANQQAERLQLQAEERFASAKKEIVDLQIAHQLDVQACEKKMQHALAKQEQLHQESVTDLQVLHEATLQRVKEKYIAQLDDSARAVSLAERKKEDYAAELQEVHAQKLRDQALKKASKIRE